jgi:hypothetical protein
MPIGDGSVSAHLWPAGSSNALYDPKAKSARGHEEALLPCRLNARCRFSWPEPGWDEPPPAGYGRWDGSRIGRAYRGLTDPHYRGNRYLMMPGFSPPESMR